MAAPRAAIAFDPGKSRWAVPDEAVRPGSFPARTAVSRAWQGERHTLLVVRPTTGRRHQIRVHLAWIGHPIAGDPLFPGTDSPDGAVRACLHAWRLEFDDRAGQRVAVEAAPDPTFWAPIADQLPPGAGATLLMEPLTRPATPDA